jgi:DNA mismatch endonuclease (patch repair protein)
VQRDQENQSRLAAEGWRILIVWECELDSSTLKRRLKRFLGSPQQKAKRRRRKS